MIANMKSLLLTMITLVLSSSLGASGIEVSEYTWDLGSIPKQAYAHHTFTIKNLRSEPIKILRIRRFCGCLIYELADTILYPNTVTNLKVGYFSGTKSTNEKNRIYLTTDDPEKEILKFLIKANVGQEIEGIRVEPRRLKIADLKDGNLTIFNDSDSLVRLKIIYATQGIEVKAETAEILPEGEAKIFYKSKYRAFSEKPSILIEVKDSRITIPIDLK